MTDRSNLLIAADNVLAQVEGASAELTALVNRVLKPRTKELLTKALSTVRVFPVSFADASTFAETCGIDVENSIPAAIEARAIDPLASITGVYVPADKQEKPVITAEVKITPTTKWRALSWAFSVQAERVAKPSIEEIKFGVDREARLQIKKFQRQALKGSKVKAPDVQVSILYGPRLQTPEDKAFLADQGSKTKASKLRYQRVEARPDRKERERPDETGPNALTFIAATLLRVLVDVPHDSWRVAAIGAVLGDLERAVGFTGVFPPEHRNGVRVWSA